MLIVCEPMILARVLEGPDNEIEWARACLLTLPWEMKVLRALISELLDGLAGKARRLTGSCLFLRELMRCQSDFLV